MSDAYTPPKNTANAPASSQNIRDQAADMARDLKHKAADVTDSLARTVKEQASTLGTTARNLSGEATAKIEDAANRQKSAGASYIGSIAQAVDRAAGEFNEIPQAASYMRHASGQIQGFADAIDGRDLRELAGEVQEFARQQPTLFFGGAVIIGFAALRFFKSAAPSSGSLSPSASNRPQGDMRQGGDMRHGGGMGYSNEPRRMG